MALSVKFVGADPFPLQVHGAAVKLPEFVLTSAGPSAVPVMRVEVDCAGEPPDGPAWPLAAAIRQMNLFKENDGGLALLTLTGERRFPLAGPAGTPVPAGCRLRLTVRVWFAEVAASGRPNPAKKHGPVEATITLVGPPATPTSNGQGGVTMQKDGSRSPGVTPFPGLVAIDFGTSNSTVTVFNPQSVKTPQGFSPEQDRRLAELLADSFYDEETEVCRVPGADPDDWRALCGRLGKALGGTGLRPFVAAVRRGGGGMLAAVLALKRELVTTPEPTRDLLTDAYDRITSQALREPRLESQNLFPVHLNLTRREWEETSELRIDPAKSGPAVKVHLGEEVAVRRRAALAGADGRNPAAVRAEFHHSPKRYLGQNLKFEVPSPGGKLEVTSGQLVQGALDWLLDRTDQWREKREEGERLSPGAFTSVVVTYPTVASPAVREELIGLTRSLMEARGIPKDEVDVVADYDEATAAALFYLHREFGGSLDLGPEEFKTRSHRSGGVWYQHVLVFDIGGGSTDLALLQLGLQEVDPFPPGADRGAGGRCYVLTPRLLGASGNTQLGGELITLRVFQLLKSAIADALLTAVSDRAAGGLPDGLRAAVRERLSSLGPAYVSDDEYRPGSLLRPVETGADMDPEFRAALGAAEDVLPTRFLAAPERLQAFYALWELAEKAKLKLGGPDGPDGVRPEFVLDSATLGQLLPQFGLPVSGALPASASVRLTADQFDRVAGPVVAEAVRIALGLLFTRLRDGTERSVPLDWLILSGKSCQLDLVRRQLREAFVRSPDLVWNAERVTFLPRYAKLATSAGACYGEHLRRLAFNPSAALGPLPLGLNQLVFNVDNLFFFLPCSFKLFAQGQTTLPVFAAGEKLYQLDDDASGKARQPDPYSATEAGLAANEESYIHRWDYEATEGNLWGTLLHRRLAAETGLTEAVYLREVRQQFEVDHRLNIRAFLWRGDRPHYLIDPAGPGLNLGEAWRKAHPGKPDAEATLIEGPRKARWDIAFLAQNAQVSGSAPPRWIKADDELIESFRAAGGDSRPGLVRVLAGGRGPGGQEIDPWFEPDTQLEVHFRPAGAADEGYERQTLSIPPGDGASHFRRRYVVSLDAEGVLRLHLGEPQYWTAATPAEMAASPGRVLVRPLSQSLLPPNDQRNPFSGVH